MKLASQVRKASVVSDLTLTLSLVQFSICVQFSYCACSNVSHLCVQFSYCGMQEFSLVDSIYTGMQHFSLAASMAMPYLLGAEQLWGEAFSY